MRIFLRLLVGSLLLGGLVGTLSAGRAQTSDTTDLRRDRAALEKGDREEGKTTKTEFDPSEAVRLQAGADEGHERLQDAIDRLYPYALTLFEPGDEKREARIVEMGVREEALGALRAAWHDRVDDYLGSLGLRVPPLEPPERSDGHVSPTDLPDHVGRDGDHTDHWPALFAEMTGTYEDLGRDHATRIMDDDE